MSIDPLSDSLRRMEANPAAVSRLRRSGYMSSLGVPFKCGSCDFFRPVNSRAGVGDCSHPEIRAVVESNGCCNYFTYEGVHG
jgi:hypothetical protein